MLLRWRPALRGRAGARPRCRHDRAPVSHLCGGIM